ncbi:hypothetical protein NRQ48_RS14910 [Escherichia coli]|nr:hypothetical protein [Escherichia coli]
MITATCAGSKIDVFQLFEEYEIVSKNKDFIQVRADDGTVWNIPHYNDETYEVTDANGDKAIFVID